VAGPRCSGRQGTCWATRWCHESAASGSHVGDGSAVAPTTVGALQPPLVGVPGTVAVTVPVVVLLRKQGTAAPSSKAGSRTAWHGGAGGFFLLQLLATPASCGTLLPWCCSSRHAGCAAASASMTAAAARAAHWGLTLVPGCTRAQVPQSFRAFGEGCRALSSSSATDSWPCTFVSVLIVIAKGRVGKENRSQAWDREHLRVCSHVWFPQA